MKKIHGGNTAIKRGKASAPLNYLIDHRWIDPKATDQTILDHGAGHGADVRHLDRLGVFFSCGYDPQHGKQHGSGSGPMPKRGAVVAKLFDHLRFDVILSTYVLNVLPNRRAVINMIAKINSLLNPQGHAFITVRADVRKGSLVQADVHLELPLIKQTSSYRIYYLRKATT